MEKNKIMNIISKTLILLSIIIIVFGIFIKQDTTLTAIGGGLSGSGILLLYFVKKQNNEYTK